MFLAALAVIVLLSLRIWGAAEIMADIPPPYGAWTYHALGFALFAAIALFIDRLIRYFFWRGVVARRMRRPTPALIEDIVTVCLVIIALSIALSFELHMDVAAIITAGGATAIVTAVIWRLG